MRKLALKDAVFELCEVVRDAFFAYNVGKIAREILVELEVR
jgi:hypothetical protein